MATHERQQAGQHLHLGVPPIGLALVALDHDGSLMLHCQNALGDDPLPMLLQGHHVGRDSWFNWGGARKAAPCCPGHARIPGGIAARLANAGKKPLDSGVLAIGERFGFDRRIANLERRDPARSMADLSVHHCR